MFAFDFVSLIQNMSDQPDRSVMARIALNTLYDHDQFPVDMSELLSLQHSANIHATKGFLDYCAAGLEGYSSWNLDQYHISKLMRAALANPSMPHEQVRNAA